MSDPYERVKGGRLTFKDGSLATRAKFIDKKKHKKKKSKITDDVTTVTTIVTGDVAAAIDGDSGEASVAGGVGEEAAYTIDPMKRMNYEQLFPVEAKKFRYDPINADYKAKTMEGALDDRVKKKADRYCK